MGHRHDPDLPPELRQVARELEDHRPSLGEAGRDRVRHRMLAAVGVRVPDIQHHRGGAPVRSRLSITATLVAGLLLSGGGAAMGVSALSTGPNASVAQYGTSTTTATTTSTGTTSTSGGAPIVSQGGTTTPTPPPVAAGVDSIDEESAPTISPVTDDEPAAATQAARQLEAADDDELPFTGYAAIPILLIGLALLATGVVLRRRGLEGASHI